MNNNRSEKYRHGAVARNLVRGLLAGVFALAATGIASAQFGSSASGQIIGSGSGQITGSPSGQQDPVLRFDGGIGVIPVSGVAADGTVRLNVVRGVNPGSPWQIANLDAVVRNDGHIEVVGRHLLLANGNGIGTNGGVSVHATLFCGNADSTATPFDSAAVALEADGDFRIDGFLTAVPPSPCTNPAMLIRVGQPGGGVWFAAGIPRP